MDRSLSFCMLAAMSLAFHLFLAEPFSKEAYSAYLEDIRLLYGEWDLVDEVPLNDDTERIHIHDGWVSAWERLPMGESFRVNIRAEWHDEQVVPWGFDFEWYLSLETGAGRHSLGLAVQLGAFLMAMQRFEFILALDRDSALDDEPTECRSIAAMATHWKRLLASIADVDYLRRRGVIDAAGYLILPPVGDGRRS